MTRGKTPEEGFKDVFLSQTMLNGLKDFNVQLAKNLCPVANGKLKKSIKGKVDGGKIIVGTNVKYAGFVEFGCFFSENINILTNRGFVLLGHLKVGDYVFTHKKRFRKILNKYTKKINVGETIGKITITTNKNKKLTVTEEHPFYVKRKNKYVWIKAENLQLNDEVVVI